MLWDLAALGVAADTFMPGGGGREIQHCLGADSMVSSPLHPA
jgi:hypothetical protein